MSLTAYLKPTNFCSIDCEHCYLTKEVRSNKQVMTEEKLVSTAKLLNDLSRREGHDGIHIVWHGGEPLMLTPEWYLWAIDILDRELGEENYSQSIQTSLLPYSSKWKDLIHNRFGAFVGSSIDFSQRKMKESSSNYLSSWLKKVSMARQDGIEVLPGMVPTKMEIGKGDALVGWFAMNGFGGFNIERYSHYGEKSIYIPSNREHAKFLIEIFDSVMRRISDGELAPKINVVVAAISGVLFGLPGERWGTSCQRQFVVIEPDGSLNSCPDRSSHEKPFSNVDSGAVGFMSSGARRDWIRVQNITHKKDHCTTCEYNYWCKSGCPITRNGPSEGEAECSGYKTYLKHIDDFSKDSDRRDLLIKYINGDVSNGKQ